MTRPEVSSFDQSLDQNGDIDRQLRANPALINDTQYLQDHPQLQAYLSAHPNVKEEIREKPNYFMGREKQFDTREAQAENRSRSRNTNPNPDLTNGEVSSFDHWRRIHNWSMTAAT